MRTNKLLAGLAALLVLVVGGLVCQGDVAATSLSTRMQVLVSPSLTGTVGLQSVSTTGEVGANFTLANGTGLNQADQIYTHTYAILTGATEDIDLKASLTDAFGAAFTPAKVKAIYIESCGAAGGGCTAANTTNLTVLGDANSVPILSTAATTFVLTPGDVFFFTQRAAAGIAVTAGTGDIIQIVNAAGATAYVKVVIVGTSA